MHLVTRRDHLASILIGSQGWVQEIVWYLRLSGRSQLKFSLLLDQADDGPDFCFCSAGQLVTRRSDPRTHTPPSVLIWLQLPAPVVLEVMVIIYLHLSLERLYGAVWLALAQRGVMDRSVSSSVM